MTYAIPLLLSKHLLKNALGYALLLLRLTFYVSILYLEKLTLLGGVKDDFFEIISFSKVLSKLCPLT